MLNYDNRIKIPISNERVFGVTDHNNTRVRSEVYDWIYKMRKGTSWYERPYSDHSGRYRELGGMFFYFEDRDLAMLFKLTWGGE